MNTTRLALSVPEYRAAWTGSKVKTTDSKAKNRPIHFIKLDRAVDLQEQRY